MTAAQKRCERTIYIHTLACLDAAVPLNLRRQFEELKRRRMERLVLDIKKEGEQHGKQELVRS